MAYRRRQYRRSSGQRDKYSVEQTGFAYGLPTEPTNGLRQQAVVVVPPVDVQGMRKVKHLTVSLTQIGGDQWAFHWALVFVPQGYTPNALYSLTGSVSGSVYEPNQFVLNAGIADPTAGPVRIRSPISRNLNSGDAIYLVYGVTQAATGSVSVTGIVRYAVTLQ